MDLDPSALVTQFLHLLHQREVQEDDPVVVISFGHAYQQLTQFTRQTDRATQDRILHVLADGLSPAQSNWEFGCLANTCGIVVEHGGDPTIAVAKILDRITGLFAQVPEFVRIMHQMGIEHPNRVAENDWPSLRDAHPEHAWVIAEWHALRFTGCAAMTMLCRDVASRQAARERIDLMQRAEAGRGDNPYAYYISELLSSVDDERLLVLDTTRQLGFRVRLTAIRNNFHLFTLLQDALLAHPSAADWQGPRVKPLLVSMAKGERTLADIPASEWDFIDGDAAVWSYCTGLGEPPEWIWGEMKPTAIPGRQGERIVVLKSLELARRWDIGFFAPLHPALRSSVRVESMLSDEEYRAWIAKLVDSSFSARQTPRGR